VEEKKANLTTIDEYIEQYPEDIQQILAKIRAVIKETAPEADEKIAYQMPGFYLNGYLVYFAINKRHIGFYPRTSAMEANIPELANYKGTKGSVHFPLDQPIPFDVIRKIVAVRVNENLEKSGSKREKQEK
jgi:uncharacterized protein YdhG (YjbR/CyaY superfamily)